MNTTIQIATTDAERRAIFRLRYTVYVEEMQIFGDVADHKLGTLSDSNDPTARLMYATVDGEVVGTLRLNLGKDASFSEEFNQTYNLARFRPAASDEQMMILTRFMVKEEYRGTPLAFQMICEIARIGVEEGIEIAFCDCQPHLIRYYQRIGFRGYESPVYNDPEFGIMVPMAFLFGDPAYLRSIRAPVHRIIAGGNPNHDAACRLLQHWGTPNVQDMDKEADVETVLRDVPFFEGLEKKEAKAIASRGYVFDVAPGDRVIRQGQTARTVFVVLSGSLEMRSGEGFHTEATSGDVVGESAFLLSIRRPADVYAGIEGARVLSLDEQRLQRLVNKPNRLAALLLLNMSKALARKITAMRPPALLSDTSYAALHIAA